MRTYKGTSRNSVEIVPDSFGQVWYRHPPKDDSLVIF